jgi:hypothetical protein
MDAGMASGRFEALKNWQRNLVFLLDLEKIKNNSEIFVKLRVEGSKKFTSLIIFL